MTELQLAIEAFTNNLTLSKQQARVVVEWYGPYVLGAWEPAIVVAARNILEAL